MGWIEQVLCKKLAQKQVEGSMEMKYLNVVLDTRRSLVDGTYPLKLRLLHEGKYSYQRISGLSIPKSDWDQKRSAIKSSHPHAELYNLLIAKEYNEVLTAFLKHQLSDCKRPFTLNASGDQSVKSFLQYGQDVISQLQKAGREGTAAAINDALRKIEAIEKKPFKPSEVTASRLSQWETEMLSKGLKINSVASYMRSIRSVYNRAIKEGLFTPNINAFKVYTIRTEATRNRSISKEALIKIIRYKPDEGMDHFHVRNIFLLSFYLIGMNVGDVMLINRRKIEKDRLVYKRRKTSKLYSVKLLPQAQEIIDYYLLPVDEEMTLFEAIMDHAPSRRALSNYGCKINKVLKQIAEELDIKEYVCSYSARYTWVSIARELGTPKDVISEALGHSYGNKVTGVYVNQLNPEVVDGANRSVLREIDTN